MDWFFDGLGTLLIGLAIGGGAGGALGFRVGVKSVRQSQKARDNATQLQVGRDQVPGPSDVGIRQARPESRG